MAYEEKYKITVVLPVYNMEEVMEDAIGDILDQDYQNWELIVVDDASDDDTAAIAEDFAQEDDRIRIIRHEEHQDWTATYNDGFAAADQDSYIMMLDATDRFEPEMLSVIGASLRRQQSDVVVTGVYKLLYNMEGEMKDQEELFTATGFFNTEAKEDDLAWGTVPGKEAFAEVLDELDECGLYYQFWNKAYKASYVRELGVTFEADQENPELAFNQVALDQAKTLTVLEDMVYDRIALIKRG